MIAAGEVYATSLLGCARDVARLPADSDMTETCHSWGIYLENMTESQQKEFFHMVEMEMNQW